MQCSQRVTKDVSLVSQNMAKLLFEVKKYGKLLFEVAPYFSYQLLTCLGISSNLIGSLSWGN